MGMDRAIKKKYWTVKRIIWLAIIVGTAISLTWATATVGSKSTYRMKADYATIATVKNGKFLDFTPLRATVEPSRSQPINIQQGGTVVEIYAEEGDIVKAGDPLVKFENPDFELSVLERAGNISEQINRGTEARLTLDRELRDLRNRLADQNYSIKKKEEDLARKKSLEAKQLISAIGIQQLRDDLEFEKNKRDQLKQDLDAQEKLYPGKKQQLDKNDERDKLHLKIVESSRDNLTTRAPISGQIVDMEIENGEKKGAGPLGRIDNIETFILSAEIAEHYINRVIVGQTATFTFNQTPYKAEISKVFPTVKNGNFKVRLKFSGEQPTDLRRGLTLQLRLELSAASDSLLLANGSFIQDTGGNWAFVLDASGKVATRRDISLGRRNKDAAEIRSGLREGERVIISSYSGLEDIDEVILTD